MITLTAFILALNTLSGNEPWILTRKIKSYDDYPIPFIYGSSPPGENPHYISPYAALGFKSGILCCLFPRLYLTTKNTVIATTRPATQRLTQSIGLFTVGVFSGGGVAPIAKAVPTVCFVPPISTALSVLLAGIFFVGPVDDF